jgi:DNA-binding GntR family transcriptional regulator
LFDLSDRVRHLSVRQNGNARDVIAEHQAIMDAVVSRDAPKAIHLLNAHFSRTAEIAITAMSDAETPGSKTASLVVDFEKSKARIRAAKYQVS